MVGLLLITLFNHYKSILKRIHLKITKAEKEKKKKNNQDKVTRNFNNY